MPAKLEEEEEDKKVSAEAADDDDAPKEEQLAEEQERDPDEAVLAEQAIKSYVEEVLVEIEPQLETAMENFSTWVLSQPDAEVFKDPGFLEQAISTFRDQLAQVFGGMETPIGQQMVGMIVEQAQRAQAEAATPDLLASRVSTACRDACWYLRDNVEGVLSNQWDQLRDLAYEGSTEFIPVLHELGLPMMDLNPQKISEPMIATAENYRSVVPEKKEEVAEKEGDNVDEETKDAAEEEQDKFLEEDEKKSAVA